MGNDLEQKILDHLVDSKEQIGGLLTEVQGINARLDRLNGSVARHEKSINELEQTRVTAAAVKEDRQIRKSGFWDRLKTVAAVMGPIIAIISVSWAIWGK